MILISQGSSEHSICFAVPQEQAERAAARRARGLRARAAATARSRASTSIADCSDPRRRRRRHGGHARRRRARSSSALGQRGRQRPRDRAGRVRAQHLRRDRRAEARRAALRAVHAGFYLSPHTLSIGVIGPGIGRQRAARPARVAGASACSASSSSTCACAASCPRSACCSPTRAHRRSPTGAGALSATASPLDLDALRRARARRPPAARGDHRLHRERGGRAALRELARARASTSSRRTRRRTAPTWRTIERMREARRASGAHYLYEATVGAGLP